MMDEIFDENQDLNLDDIKLKAGFLGQRMIVLPKDVISSAIDNPLTQTLYITDIGFFPRAEHHFRERKKGAKEYILIYCIQGSGVIEVYNQTLKINPNTFFIIPPETPHKYYAVKKDPWSIYWLHFRGSLAIHLFTKFNTKAPGPKKAPFDEKRVRLFENLMDALEKGYSADHLEYINISLWQLFSSFLYQEYFEEVGKTQKEGDLIGVVIQYMQDNLENPITVAEIAEKFNYSSSHFFALFKKKTGYSPIHYFNQLKIQKGCQYLSFTDISVKELSFKLGFEDPLYFSRLFRKIMGVSPKQYRKEYKG